MSTVLESGTALEKRTEAAVTPMHLLQTAVSQGATIDTIERLAKLQKEMMEFDAKVAFDIAMQRAQSEMRIVSTDANNPQTRSRYATYARLDNAIRPIYSRHGLAVSFNTAEAPHADAVRVVAYVSHTMGHTRTYQIDMPADGKGAKGGDVMTKTHATGAAVAYGKRYLVTMIFNIAIGDVDDDGNGASAGPKMQPGNILEWRDAIESAGTRDELHKVYTDAYKIAQKIGDTTAMNTFINAKDQRKKQLEGGAR